jgi:O-antigen/teichoic acid export membrane protein
MSESKPNSQTPEKRMQFTAGHKKNIVTAAKGGSITFAGQLFEFGISFVFAVIVARYLGAENYGLYRLSLTIVLMTAALSMLGLAKALNRYIAIARTQQNDREIFGLLQVGIGLPVIVSSAISLIIFVFADQIAQHVFSESGLAPVLRIMCLAIPVMTMARSFGAAAQGFKQLQFEVFSQNISFNVIKLILSIAAIALGFGVSGVAWAYVISSVCGFSVILLLVHRYFSLARSFGFAVRRTREWLMYSLPIFFSQFMNQFGRKFETMILGIFGVVAEVGVYSAILILSEVGSMGYNALMKISAPIIAELHSENKTEELKRYYQAVTKWSITFNLPIFVAILLLKDNLLLLLGEEFLVGASGLVILAAGTLISASTGTSGTLINMTGHSKINMYNSILYLITTLVLDFILIPKYRLLGAAYAGALTIVIVNLVRVVQVYMLVDRLLPFNRGVLKSVAAVSVAGSVVFFLKNVIYLDHPILQLVVLTVILFGVYIILIKLLGLSPEDKLIVGRLAGWLKRK